MTDANLHTSTVEKESERQIECEREEEARAGKKEDGSEIERER